MEAGNAVGEYPKGSPVEDNKNEAAMMLEKGMEQAIVVGMKAMLEFTVGLLGSKQAPVFSKISCGGNGVKYSISFEVPVGEGNSAVVVDGSECITEQEAQGNAALFALKYINENCRVRVLDFSSRVVTCHACHNTTSSATEAFGLVKKMVDSLDVALWKCREVGLELDRKAMRDPISSSIDGSAHMYMELSKYLMVMVKSQSGKSFAARTKLKNMEFEKASLDRKRSEKRKEISEKSYLKTVVIPAKGLLEYVLCYLGLPKPSYFSSLHRSGSVKSVVQFFVPYMDHLKLCGLVNVKAKADRTVVAEENAAFEALSMIEKNLNVKIVDLNHLERVEAEEHQKALMGILEKIVGVGEEVKESWEGLMQSVNEKLEETDQGDDDTTDGGGNIAGKVCHERMQEVAEFVGDCYSDFWQAACKLKKIKCHLYGSKLKLGMISVPRISH